MKFTEIDIVHNDPSFQLPEFPYPLYVNVYDIGSKEGKKKGWEIKNEWGAKKDPFIVCYKDGIVIKAFYSEADNNVINSLIKYLNGEN